MKVWLAVNRRFFSRLTVLRLAQLVFGGHAMPAGRPVFPDSTTLNRQDPDVGPQYRSAIFYANKEQKRVAEAYIKQINDAHVFGKSIVTQVVPLVWAGGE